jgi:hypothetical protein
MATEKPRAGGGSQQARKEQEGKVVRRLTVGTGAAALGLAWYFTSSAATAAPVALAQPATGRQPVVGIEQLDDHVFVRTVHVTPAITAPEGGVAAAGARQAAGGQATAGGQAPASIAQPVAPAAAPPPPPAPVATTGGSTPPKH